MPILTLMSLQAPGEVLPLLFDWSVCLWKKMKNCKAFWFLELLVQIAQPTQYLL